jgi:hypothetical protein
LSLKVFGIWASHEFVPSHKIVNLEIEIVGILWISGIAKSSCAFENRFGRGEQELGWNGPLAVAAMRIMSRLRISEYISG